MHQMKRGTSTFVANLTILMQLCCISFCISSITIITKCHFGYFDRRKKKFFSLSVIFLVGIFLVGVTSEQCIHKVKMSRMLVAERLMVKS